MSTNSTRWSTIRPYATRSFILFKGMCGTPAITTTSRNQQVTLYMFKGPHRYSTLGQLLLLVLVLVLLSLLLPPPLKVKSLRQPKCPQQQ